jgi:hypothetical protein
MNLKRCCCVFAMRKADRAEVQEERPGAPDPLDITLKAMERKEGRFPLDSGWFAL